jgi:hypothetical protein
VEGEVGGVGEEGEEDHRCEEDGSLEESMEAVMRDLIGRKFGGDGDGCAGNERSVFAREVLGERSERIDQAG